MNYNKADFIASYGISSQLPESDRPELSFSGRSNVGKSSLINKLCNRKNLARVSSTPGKTATINFYAVDDCYFVDLPGYGYAKVSNADRERWDDLINSYFEAQRHHTLLVQLIDCRHAPSADDIQMLHYLHYHNIPFVVALTKADKLKKSMAAYREGMKTVLIPKDNLSDLYEVDDEVKKNIEFLPMSNLSQVLAAALLKPKTVSAGHPRTRKVKPAEAAALPQTAEKPQPGAVC